MSEQINPNNPKLDEIAQEDYNTKRMPGETDEQLIQRLHNIIDQRAQAPKQPDENKEKYPPLRHMSLDELNEYIDKGALYDTVWDFFEGKKSVSKKAVLELIDKAPAVDLINRQQTERDSMLEDLQFRTNQVIEQQAKIEKLKSEISILKASNQNLQDLYQKEKAKVEKAKQKLIEVFKKTQNAIDIASGAKMDGKEAQHG